LLEGLFVFGDRPDVTRGFRVFCTATPKSTVDTAALTKERQLQWNQGRHHMGLLDEVIGAALGSEPAAVNSPKLKLPKLNLRKTNTRKLRRP
jgi:hypothetical protein